MMHFLLLAQVNCSVIKLIPMCKVAECPGGFMAFTTDSIGLYKLLQWLYIFKYPVISQFAAVCYHKWFRLVMGTSKEYAAQPTAFANNVPGL